MPTLSQIFDMIQVIWSDAWLGGFIRLFVALMLALRGFRMGLRMAERLERRRGPEPIEYQSQSYYWEPTPRTYKAE